ncbi:peptidase M41 [Pseudomonas sp. NPDC089569]|uniref:peptidase M41 n=1 Tax=Pseudomonas sp. NPDC089569 TaxID=3390722 RepID=UPI003D0766BA
MSSKMPSAVRDHALQIAHHEMGHYVVARALGFATGGVTLSVSMDLRHKGGASINLVRPLSSMQAMKQYLEARMMVLFAGVMAQTLPSNPGTRKRVDTSKAIAILKGAHGAERDDAKIRELRHLLRNIDYPDSSPESICAELKAINDRLWRQTQDLVEAMAATITELAVVLVDRMALVEQWGTPADTYEGVLTAEMLEPIYRRSEACPRRTITR